MSTLQVSRLGALNTDSGGILLSNQIQQVQEPPGPLGGGAGQNPGVNRLSAYDGVVIPNLRLNVINRGDPAAGDALVELRTFDQVHYYQTAGAVLNLRTSVVPNAIYEFTYTSSGGAANIDFVLNPNGANYSNEFRDQYYFTVGGGGFSRVDQTLSTIYFDHLAGGTGVSPMGTFRFTTGPTNKYYTYKGSDNENLVFGYGRWTNNSRTWDFVGQLNFNGDNKRCWIRRIG